MAEALNTNINDPAISRLGIKLERDYALIDARDKINELGELIEIRLHEEETVERGEFNNIIRRIPNKDINFSFYAFPVIFNPTTVNVQAAGLKEKTTAIIYTSMIDWWKNSFDMDRLDKLNIIRMSIIINEAVYEISEKNFLSQFSDTYLYVTLGLNKV